MSNKIIKLFPADVTCQPNAESGMVAELAICCLLSPSARRVVSKRRLARRGDDAWQSYRLTYVITHLRLAIIQTNLCHHTPTAGKVPVCDVNLALRVEVSLKNDSGYFFLSLEFEYVYHFVLFIIIATPLAL